MDITIRGGATELLSEERVGELEQLASLLGADGHNATVERTEPHGRGVTWWIVVGLYLSDKFVDGITGHAVDAALGGLGSRVMEWVHSSRRASPELARPRYVAIYGPDGRVLRSVLVQPDGTEEDRTAHDQAQWEWEQQIMRDRETGD